jgi:hypothetical protein
MSHGRSATLLASGGVLCALALIPLAFFAPVYHGTTVTTGGAVEPMTGTEVGVNGLYVVWLLCIPVALAFVAWAGLHLRCSHASSLGGRAAWAAVVLLLAFTVVGLASVGVFVLPAALLLLAAAALTPAAGVSD